MVLNMVFHMNRTFILLISSALLASCVSKKSFESNYNDIVQIMNDKGNRIAVNKSPANGDYYLQLFERGILVDENHCCNEHEGTIRIDSINSKTIFISWISYSDRKNNSSLPKSFRKLSFQYKNTELSKYKISNTDIFINSEGLAGDIIFDKYTVLDGQLIELFYKGSSVGLFHSGNLRLDRGLSVISVIKSGKECNSQLTEYPIKSTEPGMVERLINEIKKNEP